MDNEIVELRLQKLHEKIGRVLQWIQAERDGLALSDGVEKIEMVPKQGQPTVKQALQRRAAELRVELQAALDVLPGGE